MSGGKACKCDKPDWEVIQYKCNYSAFEYPARCYHKSDYSLVHCKNCEAYWRTKAKYVDELPEKDRSDERIRSRSWTRFLPYN